MMLQRTRILAITATLSMAFVFALAGSLSSFWGEGNTVWAWMESDTYSHPGFGGRSGTPVYRLYESAWRRAENTEGANTVSEVLNWHNDPAARIRHSHTRSRIDDISIIKTVVGGCPHGQVPTIPAYQMPEPWYQLQ